MPIIKSAKKRMRQQDAKRLYNVAVKTSVKKQLRAVKDEVATGKVTSAALVAAVAQLDTAVRKGVLHKRTADRKKSRLTKEYNSLATKPYGTENPGKPGEKKKAVKKPAAKAVAKKAPAKKAAAKKPAAKK
jgi:small subunit ribosomal protein S20